MNKSNKKKPSEAIFGWDEKQASKVEAWLQSAKGKKKIESIPSKLKDATEAFSSMIIVNPDQLREPYTI